VLPASPKPTKQEPTKQEPTQDSAQAEMPAQVDIDAANAALNSVIQLKARLAKSGATATRETASLKSAGLVTVRAKPEKRLNARDRAMAKREKDKPEAAEVSVVTPEAANPVAGLSTAHPKPEKRKNAKERAKEKFAKKDTEDGTTPMTAKAKSKVEKKEGNAKRSKPAKAA
jgi:hypothetical protein